MSTAPVSFAHGDEVVGLNHVDVLLQASQRGVIHALGWNMPHINKFNDSVVILVLVF